MDPISNPSTEVSSANSPRKGRSIHWVLIALVLVSLAICGYLLYQGQQLNKQLAEISSAIQNSASPRKTAPTPDPTADWKTYTNKELGFEIKYPKTFTISSDSIPNNGTQLTFASNQRNILIIKRPNINPLTNKQYVSLEEFDPRVKNFKLILIGQNEARDSEVYTTQGATTQRDIIMKNDDSVWIITDIPKEARADEVFSQILSTFRFLD